MSLRFWTSWSIGKRMVFITMLPVIYLFSSFIWYSYYAHRAQVAEELSDRGRVLANALAETSEYNIISGNLSDLKLTINGLIKSDQSIYRIEVIDANGQSAISVRASEVIASKAPEAQPFKTTTVEAPIRRQVLWINLFTDNGTPHVSGSSESKPPPFQTETIGVVRVTMSPSYMMARQNVRFQVELLMAAFALAISGLLAYFLGRSLIGPLRMSINALRKIRGGNYQVGLAVTTGGEIGELQASINEMSLALERSKQDLENKVAERTKDLLASRNEVQKADADKRKLIHKVNSIVEDERKSIAIEIHDELNATLIAARLESQSILQLANKMDSSPLVEQVKAKSASITKLTLDLYASGRRLVRRLRPEVLDMLGLDGAVEEMIRHYDISHPQCQFAFHAEGSFAKLGNELAISAYRIVQEALSNVIKHADASEVKVSLLLTGETLHIEVADNGAGFDPQAQSSGIGLIGMRERVAAMNGSIAWHSGQGEGTTALIDLPLN
jgi:two-component system sensor histidine kinase UhpB